jgi:carbonic anhydrase
MHTRFLELLEQNADHVRRFRSQFDDLQEAQHPGVVTVCCSDSRVLQDHMWGNDRPGQVFTCSNIGNRVVQRTGDGDVVSGDVLYPVVHAETDTVVVVGHSGCGAVTAAYKDLTEGLSEPPGIQHCIDLLRPPLEEGMELLPEDTDDTDAVNRLVEYNVDHQVGTLVESDEIPASVAVVGVVYDFQDVYSGERGEIHVVNVDGETSVDALREDYPDIRDRVERLWEYDRSHRPVVGSS